MASTKGYAFLPDKSYGDHKNGNEQYKEGKNLDNSVWKVVENDEQASSNFQGVMYQNTKTGEYVYAIRGAQEPRDFLSDGKMAFSGGVDQFGYADRMLQEWKGR
ncbi:hypothetical protein [Aeromonas caviae]|uniref:hypothetical protein n=1 Tax=Aeromonas caviae TaxID=648 RepID=UPI002B48543A|nr:hypothetical protein [Aeromonas caviae]